MARENDYLDNATLESLKKTLLLERQKLANKGTLKPDDYCLAKDELADVLDEANANIQASQMLRFRNREIFYLKKINKALSQIDHGVYGLCESCGIDIGIERMKARPTAELCISCKEESENIEKHNFFQKQSKSLGKSLQDLSR